MAIDPRHPLIIDTLTTVLKNDIDLPSFHMNIADYDGDIYMIAGISDTMLAFTMLSKEIKSIGDAGGYEAIQQHLQGFPTDTSNPESFSVIIDKSQLPSSPEQRSLSASTIAEKFSTFRTIFISGPFIQALTAAKQGTSFTAKQVNIRKGEKLYLIPGDGRVTFVFQILYKDSNDASLAKIFLQEFQDSKKQISNAPVITFGSVPPENIRSFNPKTEGLFLSITMLRDQINNPLEQAKWVSSLRQYLTYHIHSCKTYLHMRMRKRADLLYNELKQAVPEKLEEKTFKRVRATKAMKEEARIINNFRA